MTPSIKQLDQVRGHIKRYGRITSWDAIQDFRCTRLSQYILLLRKEGLKIISVWETNGEKRWVAYKLVNP